MKGLFKYTENKYFIANGTPPNRDLLGHKYFILDRTEFPALTGKIFVQELGPQSFINTIPLVHNDIEIGFSDFEFRKSQVRVSFMQFGLLILQNRG